MSALQNQGERVVALEQRSSHTERRVEALEQRGGGGFSADKRDQLGSRVNNLEKEVTQMVEQFQRASRSGALSSSTYTSDIHTGALPSTLSSHGAPSVQQFEAMSLKLAELDHSLDRCLSSSLDQELRLQLLERATYNGILLWKIDDFARQKREAVDGVTPSLYSTPFYTSRHGYKMCARIYLNGDGLGEGTHLSFFFVIMRGPYDALLTWPFKQKVMLTLLNQAGKGNVTYPFCPDPQNHSFQRPDMREINIAFGCSMFIRLEHLMTGGFVKENSIFLQVIVDTADLPKVVP